MNQVAASILVLSASICGFGAALRPATDSLAGALGLVAIALAVWGGMALLGSTVNYGAGCFDDEEDADPEMSRAESDSLRSLLLRRGVPQDAVTDSSGYRLTPETSAQLSLVAQLKGKHRADVVEDILRHHLPRYTPSSRAA